MILLIEPYWNVNIGLIVVAIGALILLIEPYWNVNRDHQCIHWNIYSF